MTASIIFSQTAIANNGSSMTKKPSFAHAAFSILERRLERLDDQALMKRIGTGDHRAYGVLVRRFLPKLLSVARRYTGANSDAEDIVQEALTRLWLKAPQWFSQNDNNQGASVTTWLYRVIVNLCIDRHRNRSTKTVDLALVAESIDPQPNAQTSLEHIDAAKKVRTAIDALPERQRMAMVLCFFEEMSNAEAAMMMDLSIGAVESLLVRARRQLRDDLADYAKNEWGITGDKL